MKLDGVAFRSVEHSYQAAKTLDPEERRIIAGLESPTEAKRHGRRLKLRDNWDDLSVSVMEDLLRQKFGTPELREKLLATGDAYLEERNAWSDRWWGVCGGVGENNLGRLPMQVRAELRRSAEGHRPGA